MQKTKMTYGVNGRRLPCVLNFRSHLRNNSKSEALQLRL